MPAAPLFSHTLLTRFNIRMPGRPKPSTEWLLHRLDLFKRYCLPSVASQTVQDFRWILFADPSTPAEFVRMLKRCRRTRPFDICYVREFYPPQSLCRFVAFHTRPFLISTRLDNDDAIHRLFVEDVQNAFHGQKFEWINFPWGYVLDEKRGLFRAHQSSNAFISLIESLESSGAPHTVHCVIHTRAATRGPVKQAVVDAPRWLQVVHSKNIFNHVGPNDVPVASELVAFNVCPETRATAARARIID